MSAAGQQASKPAPERRIHGVGASDGVVVGVAHLLADVTAPTSGEGGPEEQARAAQALQTVGERLGEAAARRRAAGYEDEAEILEAAQLMAGDPSLLDEIAALAEIRPAVTAILEATERQADLLAAIPDPYLSARAADVRRLGKQAARLANDIIPSDRESPLTPQPPLPHELWGPRCAARISAAPTSLRASPGHAGERETNSMPPLSRTQERGLGGEGFEGHPAIIIARDLGPADFAELELTGVQIAGIALAEGSGASHAAIVARGLAAPLVVGLGEDALSTPDGASVVLNGTDGLLIISPGAETLQAAQAEVTRLRQRREHLAQSRAAGAVTRDGQQIRLLVNASAEREALAGLEAGAAGVGLLRTELAFLEAVGWPSAAAHAAAVRPILAHLGGRIATVRTLDFGADKTPPFLRGRPERGVALQLAAPGALAEQLRGMLQAALPDQPGQTPAQLRIMLPLVERVEQLAAARELLATAHAELLAAAHAEPLAQDGPAGRSTALPLPQLGAMIETRAAVQQIEAIAAAADFLSIGTNDLSSDILGVDRLTPSASVRAAADSRVLQAIRAVTTAAARHGRTVEVCGEAAGDPRLAILLLGLGVSELSVAPSRLDEVRAMVQAVTLADAATLAQKALNLPAGATADDTLSLFDTLATLEALPHPL